MTPKKKPVFSGSDVWVLLSIAMREGGDGADLRDIISIGDYINHAILTGPEIRRGLAKLLFAGYLRENNGRFHIAGKAKLFWRRLRNSRKPVLRVWDEWEIFLKVPSHPEPDSRTEEAQWPYPAISDEMVKQAYDEYVASF